MRNFVYVLILFLTLSCQNNRKKDIAYLVNQWTNKEIIFPERPVFTVYTSDTTGYLIPSSPYKVLIYADSIGCMSCKMQLDKWKSFIKEADSVTNGTVPFLFFLDSRQIKDIRHLLRRDKFTHPVCVDTEGQLNRLNQFADDPTFHTFLLDNENKVVLIGNPVHNNAVKELYLNEFKSLQIP